MDDKEKIDKALARIAKIMDEYEKDPDGDYGTNKEDIDEDFTTDEESAQMEMDSNVEQDRAQSDSQEPEARGEKAGWTMAEGSNMWSVDEKDDYWKTQEGYDEAVSLYGKKPAWVKEPTLVWNAETGEYEEVEEEEFEDLSQPTAISADIKKLFG